jgi:hypothetical protein
MFHLTFLNHSYNLFKKIKLFLCIYIFHQKFYKRVRLKKTLLILYFQYQHKHKAFLKLHKFIELYLELFVIYLICIKFYI